MPHLSQGAQEQAGAARAVQLAVLLYMCEGERERPAHNISATASAASGGSGATRGVNFVLFVSPLGTIHAYRVCLPGNVPDTTAAEPIFSWLLDRDVNPHLFGALTDYGFSKYCHAVPGLAPIARPFCPTKGSPIVDTVVAGVVAERSRWICSCRQYSEWVNGSAKRGFPR